MNDLCRDCAERKALGYRGKCYAHEPPVYAASARAEEPTPAIADSEPIVRLPGGKLVTQAWLDWRKRLEERAARGKALKAEALAACELVLDLEFALARAKDKAHAAGTKLRAHLMEIQPEAWRTPEKKP